ncbi:MAG TPA: hypothetical protein VJH94_03780 [Candidatus Paceibacterota bacterium]
MKKSQFEGIEDSAERLTATIMMDLARLYFETSDLGVDEYMEWKLKFSAKFTQLLESRVDLLSLYAENRSRALGEIEKELYAEGDI